MLEIINAEAGRNEVLPNISKPMLVEKVVLELPQFEGENLVNIPIELPSYGGILKEVKQGNQKAKMLESMEMNKLNKKK